MTLQITWKQIDPSESLDEAIRSNYEKLHRYYDHIMGGRVVVSTADGHKRKGDRFHLRVEIDVPDGEILVTSHPGANQAHEDLYVVIRDAFKEARRQLQDFARIKRGRVKRHQN